MGLNKVRIGDCVELYSEACGMPNLTIYDISGVNRDKEFFSPSKSVGEDTSKYKIVPPGYFACNLMHVGRDVVLPIALNTSEKNVIVTAAYSVFKLIDEKNIVKEYFLMFCKSPEKDRNFWFHTDSSVRDGMSWKDFCDITIELPSIEIQKKFVTVYKSMVANRESYERGLDDLRITFEGYMDNLRKQHNLTPIGDYLELIETKNEDLKYNIDDVMGVSIEKKFIPTKADMTDVNLKPYYVVKPNEFAYVTVTSRNGEKISIALNDSDNTFICSSSYVAFRSKNENKLLPQYLMLFFTRSEFDRYARFCSWGSARETFDWKTMCEVRIPIPDVSQQKAIAKLYKAYKLRKEICEQLKQQIKDICPVLIKGSLEEARA